MKRLSPLERAMLICSRIARAHPWIVLFFSLIFFVVSLLLAAAFLEFQTSRDDLISSSDELHSLQQRYLEEFPASDDIVVMVKGGTASVRESYVDTLAELLERHPEHFHAIFPRVELPFLTSRALLFLPEDELVNLISEVKEARPFLLSLSSPEGLVALLSDFEGNLPGSGQEQLISMLPFLGDIFHELRRQVETRGRADYHSPWGGLLFGGTSPQLAERTQGGLVDTNFYHTTAEGSVHLLLLRMVKRDAETIALLRETVDAAQRAYRGLEVGVTGEPLLEHDEMISSEADSQQSGALSMVLVSILFVATFRQVIRPLAIVGSFMLGAGWTIGFTTLVVGHLNLLTVSFFTILVGSGIDFGIHILMRYDEEFREGGQADKAMDEALVGTGTDIAVSAFSTAAAFWAVGFTDFKGVSELGLIAGFGILLCLVATVLPLPAVIFLLDRRSPPRQSTATPSAFRTLLSQFETKLLRKAPWTLFLSLVLLAAAMPAITSVGFDYNLLRLQDQRLESVQTELRLIEEGGRTVLFSVALADDIEQARELKARFEALSTVSHVDTVSDLFPEITAGKIRALRHLKALVDDVRIPSPEELASGPVGGKRLQQMGDGFLELKRFFDVQREGLIHHNSEKIRSSTEKFEQELSGLFEELSGLGPGPIEDGLTNFQTAFFQDLAGMIEFLQAQDPELQMGLDDLPPNLKLRSIGRTGKLVLRIYPTENIWERSALDAFVAEIRSVDPTAVGAPIMIWHHTQTLKTAFETAGFHAIIAISFILLLYFRSIPWTLLAMVPLVLGVLFMLFAMEKGGISFNLANFMGLPLLLGIGMDYGVHVLHRAQEEKRVNMFGHSTGPATTLSALTTIAGFGTLALGGHQGVASLGYLLTTGVFGILLSALVVVPALLTVWSPFKEEAAGQQATGASQERLSA